MFKKNIISISASEQVIKKLTGQVGVDKDLLISSIHKFRSQDVSSSEVEILGKKLYEILLENGLTESSIINPQRLIGKAQGFMYEGKFEKALEILEVLDAVEPYQRSNKNNIKVYYVDTQIDAELAFMLYPDQARENSTTIHQEILKQYANNNIKPQKKIAESEFTISRRPIYLNLMAQIYMEMGKNNLAESKVEETLVLDPVNFDALMLKAIILKTKNLEKFKQALFECYKVSYTKHHIVSFYKELSKYYEKKNQLLNAYMILQNIKKFDDEQLVASDIYRLEVQMNKTALTRFSVPTSDEIARFFNKEKIGMSIPIQNMGLLIFMYQKAYLGYGSDEMLEEVKKILLDFNNNDTKTIAEIEKLADEMKDSII